jgi:hypothetical protein
VTAPTSTSQTLVLSEAHRATEENSPPPQDLETLTPVVSPQAPSPKRLRTGLGGSHDFLAGSSTTSSLDDVSNLAAIFLSFVEVFPSKPISQLSFCSL